MITSILFAAYLIGVFAAFAVCYLIYFYYKHNPNERPCLHTDSQMIIIASVFSWWSVFCFMSYKHFREMAKWSVQHIN